MGKGILKNQGEIEVDDKDDELPDIQEIDEDGEEKGWVEDETAAEPEVAVDEPGPARKRGADHHQAQPGEGAQAP